MDWQPTKKKKDKWFDMVIIFLFNFQILKITKRSQRASKRLVTISTSDGRWHGEWKCDYIFSLGDLQLEELAEDGHKDTQVSISLCIHKVSSLFL